MNLYDKYILCYYRAIKTFYFSLYNRKFFLIIVTNCIRNNFNTRKCYLLYNNAGTIML